MSIGFDEVTVKVAVPSPSLTVTSLIVNVAVSLSLIVPVPVSDVLTLRVPTSVPLFTARLAVNVSVSSTRLSSVIATVTVLSALSPEPKLTVSVAES